MGAVLSPDDLRQWDTLATGPHGHLHQCRWWAEPLARFGVATDVVGCWDGDELIGGALFRSMKLPVAGWSVTECLGEPLFRRWDDELAQPFSAATEGVARARRSAQVLLRHGPDGRVQRAVAAQLRTPRCPTLNRAEGDEAAIPLTGRPLGAVTRDFSTGTRRSLKKGRAGPLRVERLTSPAHLEAAYRTMRASAQRKGFVDLRPWPALEPVLRHCVDRGLGVMWGAVLEVVASAFVTYLGTTARYEYGGYLEAARALHPGHLLQAAAIAWAVDRGMDRYSLGGLSRGPEISGIDRFKLSFGARPVPWPETTVWERRPQVSRALRWARTNPSARRLGKWARRRMDHRR